MTAVDNARTQIENAKELLRTRAKPENGLYRDKRYVKKAGIVAYKGLLLSLAEIVESK